MRILIWFLLLISFSSYAEHCYKSSILSPTPFLGNHGEIVKLDDGTLWEVQGDYNYMYEYYPNATICPDSQKIIVNETSLNVQRLK